MSQPLYFVPGVTVTANTPPAERKRIVAARGLSGVLDCPIESLGFNEISGKGPGGHSGTMFFAPTSTGDVPNHLGYVEGSQEWTDLGEYWIGLDRERAPSPADLQRKRMHAGHTVVLNGMPFVVPVVRRPDHTTGLPTDMYFHNGELVEPIKAQYLAYWEATAEVLEMFMNGAELSKRRGLQLAVDALGLNYRYSMMEQNVLRLIDGETLLHVLWASIDGPGLEARQDAQKKT